MEPSDPDLQDCARRLGREREQAVAAVEERRSEVAAIAASSMTEGRDDEHDPDGATIAFEHSMAVGLLRRAEERLRSVDEALDRLRDGTYGRCLACGRQIAGARLAAEPAAPTCVGCGPEPMAGPGVRRSLRRPR